MPSNAIFPPVPSTPINQMGPNARTAPGSPCTPCRDRTVHHPGTAPPLPWRPRRDSNPFIEHPDPYTTPPRQTGRNAPTAPGMPEEFKKKKSKDNTRR
ncbi:uncharacterized protein PHACADRAFT_197953 [Phanerochaete carnosa HHB-10118-sp]|uniref:Uncharacterized protein n=1 Tax=Phanerochaete carnosa (strain HHB-10118-sp) TaxID=650164 RepID=K5W307_PHACS|nr:uncharacterized protein PHACADRAFT_197953 [Phanerochaete carnosa HHB-10118-sp]EKM53520.1 hypothetical protein PHACADRAFT_197953 [Phanerochaete carnosa HHB-10118-sp]